MNKEKIQKTDREFLADLADQVVRRRLTTLAILYLESHKPFSFAFSQMMHVATPFASIFIDSSSMERFAFIMEDRENVEQLIQIIEKRQKEYDIKLESEKEESEKESDHVKKN